MFTLKRALLSFAFVAAATLGSGSAASASATSPYCGITWGSLSKAQNTMSSAALIDARTGRHDCYDRIVFTEKCNSIFDLMLNYASQG